MSWPRWPGSTRCVVAPAPASSSSTRMGARSSSVWYSGSSSKRPATPVRPSLLLLVILWSHGALAQVVNVHPLLAAGDGKKGLKVQIEGSLDYRAGNVNLVQVGGKAILQYRRGRHTAFLLGSGELGTNRTGVFLNRV